MSRAVVSFCNGQGGCNSKFTVNYKTDRLPPDVEHTYFDCPECGLRYSCFYTDSQVRLLQAQMRDLLRRMGGGKIHMGNLQKVKAMQDRIKKEMDILKNQHRDKRP